MRGPKFGKSFGEEYKSAKMDIDQLFTLQASINGLTWSSLAKLGQIKRTLRKKSQNMRNTLKEVSIVCSTGIAATHYKDLKA